MQIRKFLRKVASKQRGKQADRQTNKDENITSLAEVKADTASDHF